MSNLIILRGTLVCFIITALALFTMIDSGVAEIETIIVLTLFTIFWALAFVFGGDE